MMLLNRNKFMGKYANHHTAFAYINLFQFSIVSPLQQVSFSFIILAKLVPINFEKV
jgi:hypothetical protein